MTELIIQFIIVLIMVGIKVNQEWKLKLINYKKKKKSCNINLKYSEFSNVPNEIAYLQKTYWNFPIMEQHEFLKKKTPLKFINNKSQQRQLQTSNNKLNFDYFMMHNFTLPLELNEKGKCFRNYKVPTQFW